MTQPSQHAVQKHGFVLVKLFPTLLKTIHETAPN